MSKRYEKPVLKPFSFAASEVGHGANCTPTGGNADACSKGQNAIAGCSQGNNASPTCVGGGTVTAS
jgi:hypothetical protein